MNRRLPGVNSTDAPVPYAPLGRAPAGGAVTLRPAPGRDVIVSRKVMLAGHRRPVGADYHRRERRIPQRRQQLRRALERPARAERGPGQAATERDQQPGAEQTEAAVGSLDPVLAGADGG